MTLLGFNPSRPNPGRKKKKTQIFIFTLLCGASKVFIKAFKASIKTFEAQRRSVKIKIEVSFYFNINFLNARDGNG